MPKPVKRPAKKAVRKTVDLPQRPRRVKLAPYRPISLKKRVKPVRPALTSSFRLFGRSLIILKKHWQLFLTIIIIYAALTILLVKGLATSTNVPQLKSAFSSLFKGPGGKLSLGLALFIELAAGSFSGNASSNNPGVYQTILLIIISLVVIWALRQLYAGTHVRAREAFYQGPAAFVPFILVLLVVGVQLIPLALGGLVYSAVISGGIAVGGGEKFVWALLFFALVLISLYLICSSLFALYIVTLPDMTPMKALRSARQLVRYRRFTVMRKIVFLPIALAVIGAIIMVPIILILAPAAEWIFFILTLISLLVVHSYMYGLYRELLL